MSEYIGRDKLLKTINENVAEAHNERCVQLLEAILNAPTADVVEVVRCKDCKYKMTANFCGEILIGCSNPSGLADVCADGFCSYGERREG